MKLINKLILFIILIGYSVSGFSQKNIPEFPAISDDTPVRIGKLDNGFTYYLKENPNGEKNIWMYLIVKAGIYHEDEDQKEHSHLLEHLGYRGTRQYPKLKKYFSAPGRFAHANTSSTYTLYYYMIPSRNSNELVNTLNIMKSVASDIDMSKTSTDIERGAVLGEMRVQNTYEKWIVNSITKQILKNTDYPIYNLSQHKNSIRNFNYKAFTRFEKEWYRPELQSAIIVGDINVDSVEVRVKEIFGDLENPQEAPDAEERIKKYTIELSGQNQYSIITDSVNISTRLYLARKNIRINAPKNIEDYKHILLKELYDLIIQNRTEEILDRYDPPFQSLTTGYKNIGMSQLDVTLMKVDLSGKKKISSFKSHFSDGLKAYRRIHTGIRPEELAEAKNYVRKKFCHNRSMGNRDLVRYYRDKVLNNTALISPEEELTLNCKLLDEITLQEFQQFVLDFSALDYDTDFLFFTGDKENIPEMEKIKDWIQTINNMDLKPFQTEKGQKIETLEKDVPEENQEDGDIQHQSTNDINVTKITLENGTKFILKPSDPISNQFKDKVSIHLSHKDSFPLSSRSAYFTTKLSSEAVEYSGAGNYSKFELDQFKRAKGIALNFWSENNIQWIVAESNIEDLPETLNLLYLYLVRPRKDSVAFESWKKQLSSEVQFGAKRSSSEFFMDRIIHEWYPKIPVLKQKDVASLNLDQTYKVFNDFFSDIGNYHITVTGDFKPHEILPILCDKFSIFSLKEKSEKIGKNTESVMDFPFKSIKEKLPMPFIDQNFIRLYFPTRVPTDLKTELELQLIGIALNERIYNRLREGSYVPFARGEWMDKTNGIFAFNIGFDTELGNEEHMINMALEELRILKREGVTEEWLREILEVEIQNHNRRIESFGYFNFWPNYLQSKIDRNEDMEDPVLKTLSYLTNFITLDDVNTAIESYLSDENLQEFIIIPQK